MKIEQFKKLYQSNNLSLDEFNQALHLLEYYQNVLSETSIDDANPIQLDLFISKLMKDDQCTTDSFIVLLRYYRMIQRNDLFIHLTKYTGGLGVIESILERMKKIVGEKKHDEVIELIDIPQLGTHPSEFPKFTQRFVQLLEQYFDKKTIEHILADNHHQIPASSFLTEKIHYENAETLDQYLQDLHQRKIEILERHLKDGTVWFEQQITKEVVDFVKSNQEILSAVRKDNYLYITKIPYDTKAYLEASNEVDKRYHGCHCPFAKESIRNSDLEIPGIWCNCSAGFGKFPFEVILDQELEIEVLKNVLQKDMICRFRIPLDGIKYKENSPLK